MEVNKLVYLLRKMKIETGSLACFGCGYEHNCSTQGCAILRETIGILEQVPAWFSTKDRLPEDAGEGVLAIVSGKPCENITLKSAYQLASYYENEGWILDEFPEWEHARVSWWMPLPKAPEEKKQ